MDEDTIIDVESRQYINPQTGLDERLHISMEFEHWRPVPSCDGYFVSNFGNIITTKHNKMKKKALNKASNGYYTIVFYNKAFPKGFISRTVHSLVVEAFLGIKSNKDLLVNHIDGDRTNNRLDNLEVCDRSYNMRHSQYALGHWSGAPRVPVMCVETNQTFPSIMEAARSLRTSDGNICAVLNGKRKTAAGYHWQKIEEDK